MHFELVAFLVFGSILQMLHCIKRDEIPAQYQTLLNQSRQNVQQKREIILSELGFVLEALSMQTLELTRNFDNKIDALKTRIVQVKTEVLSKPEALACVLLQEAAIARINTDSINETCNSEEIFDPIREFPKDLSSLSEVPLVAIDLCGELYPIPSQDHLFLECITNIILELNNQITSIGAQFDTLRNYTANLVTECLASKGALLRGKVNEISYQMFRCSTI